MSTTKNKGLSEAEIRAYNTAYHSVMKALGAAKCGRGRVAIQGALEAIVKWSTLTHAEIASMATSISQPNPKQ